MEYDYEDVIAEAIACLLDNECVDEFNSPAGWFSASNRGRGVVDVEINSEDGLRSQFEVKVTDKTYYGS